jgi:ABC-type molybdate transport system substrate-binding protein
MSRPIVLAAMLLALAFAAGCTRSDAASTAAAPSGMRTGDAASAPDAVQQAIDSLAAWPQGSR